MNVRVKGLPLNSITLRDDEIIPKGFVKCDGTNGTPDLRNKHLVGASTSKALNSTGASPTTFSHSHSIILNDITFNVPLKEVSVDTTNTAYVWGEYIHRHYVSTSTADVSVTGSPPTVALNAIKHNIKNIRSLVACGITVKDVGTLYR
jgi:hypothetical protein